MLRWTPQMSEGGFLVLAGCSVPTAPAPNRVTGLDAPYSENGVVALLEVARQFPDAKRSSVVLLGPSLGPQLIFHTLGRDTDIPGLYQGIQA